MKVPDYITFLLKEGLAIEMEHDADAVRYCLNTGMKSEAYLSFLPDGNLRISMRYGEWEVIEPNEDDYMETVRDIAHIVNTRCRHGRSFASDIWENIFVKLGLTQNPASDKIG